MGPVEEIFMGLSCGRDVISIPEGVVCHATQLRHQRGLAPHRRALHCGDDQFPHPKLAPRDPGAKELINQKIASGSFDI